MMMQRLLVSIHGLSRLSTRLRREAALAAVIACHLLVAGCTDSGGRIIGVDATGTVTAVVQVDANGNGQVDASDPGVPGVRIRLRLAGTGQSMSSGVTNNSGTVVMTGVAVGAYSLEVDAATVGDSLEIVQVSPTAIVVTADSEVEVGVHLSYPSFTIAEARTAPLGRRGFVEGVVLNARTNFGDNTIHLAGPGAAIRLTRTGAVSVAVGDSVRVLGTRSTADGQPTLDQVNVFALGPGSLPIARIVNTRTAATADNGTRDAALVRVLAGTLLDLRPTEAGYEMTLDDGSGPLAIRLDAVAPFPVAQYVEGAVLDVRGVLVPTGSPGEWSLRPRVVSDVVIISVPDPPDDN
jgi:hypothetical protein